MLAVVRIYQTEADSCLSDLRMKREGRRSRANPNLDNPLEDIYSEGCPVGLPVTDYLPSCKVVLEYTLLGMDGVDTVEAMVDYPSEDVECKNYGDSQK